MSATHSISNLALAPSEAISSIPTETGLPALFDELAQALKNGQDALLSNNIAALESCTDHENELAEQLALRLTSISAGMVTAEFRDAAMRVLALAQVQNALLCRASHSLKVLHTILTVDDDYSQLARAASSLRLEVR